VLLLDGNFRQAPDEVFVGGPAVLLLVLGSHLLLDLVDEVGESHGLALFWRVRLVVEEATHRLLEEAHPHRLVSLLCSSRPSA